MACAKAPPTLHASSLSDICVSRRLKPASDRRMSSGRLHGAFRPTGFLAATPQKEACHGECIEAGDCRGDPFLTITERWL